ncbi:MAG TPA: hypothetical protein VG755_01810 [Nannocystaceae bacterium]|nr:hypothetical protein [Nannocystaceae bacterium]
MPATAWVLLLAVAPAPRPLADAIATTGSERCLEPAALARRVEAWSGHRTVAPDVTIRVEHEPRRLVLRISGLVADDVERSFEPPPSRCRDVETAVAVALAVALDGDAIAARLDDVPIGSRRYEGTTAVIAEEPLAIAAAPRRDPPLRHIAVRPPPPRSRAAIVELGLAAGGSIGVLVRAGFESALDLRVRWRPIALRIGIDVGTRTRIPLSTSGGVVDTVRTAGSIGACLPLDRGRFTLAICAAGSGGFVQARPRHTAAPRRSWVPWAAVQGGLEGAVRLGERWSLFLRSDAVFAFVRPTIVATQLQGGAPIRLVTPAIGWRGLLGVALRLGRSQRGVDGRTTAGRRR